jgi:hypothetical protein
MSRTTPKRKQTTQKVNPDDVVLKQGKGGLKTGGMPGGKFWHIFHQGVRAGKVFINYDNDTKKAEIQIFLNQKSQGKGIGRIAYRKACEDSKYQEIYALMRKSNIASIKAALAAGFKEIPSKTNQTTMLWQKIDFPIDVFENLPDNLPNSDYIDFLLFLAKLKPALRVKIPDKATREKLHIWSINNHFSFLDSENHYVYIAPDQISVNRLKITDDSFEPHEYKLGRLLGYPECCCKKIASVGEQNIDEWEDTFIKLSSFEGEFELINPTGYTEGYSLISHIPCSSNCVHSLHIAKKALNIITHYKWNKHFDRWKYWTQKQGK